MSGRFVYLDSSAFLKLILAEPERPALVAYLRRWQQPVSATLLRTEALRAATRMSPAVVVATRRALRTVAFIDLDRDLFDRAGILGPGTLRSLDALHVAAALSLGDDLDELITYDVRMAAAAEAAGLVVAGPN